MNSTSAGILASILVIFTCVNNELLGQESAPIVFPTGNSSWTVTIVLPKSERPPQEPNAQGAPNKIHSADIEKMELTRFGEITKAKLSWTDGKSTENWWIQNPKAILTERPDTGEVQIDTLMVGASHLVPDASMFDWVTKKTPVEERAFKGKKCLYYAEVTNAPGVAPAFINMSEKQESLRQAWVESETKLPVALDDGRAVYYFTFNAPPAVPLELPEKFKTELQRAVDSAPAPKFLGKQRSWEKRAAK